MRMYFYVTQILRLQLLMIFTGIKQLASYPLISELMFAIRSRLLL